MNFNSVEAKPAFNCFTATETAKKGIHSNIFNETNIAKEGKYAFVSI